MPWQRELGAKIKEARESAFITQIDLGKRVGVTRQMIGRYESGDDSPSFYLLTRIATALELEEVTVEGVTVKFSEVGGAKPRLVQRQLRLPFDKMHTFKGATVEITPRKGRLILTAVIPA
jgi:transcriptional regulator with XRE-family HTH domain